MSYLGARLLAPLALALLCAPAAVAGQPLRIAVQENSAPKYLAQLQTANAAEGICPDVLRAIERQDPSVRFVFEPLFQPLKRIEHGMALADTDANCLADNAERRAADRSQIGSRHDPGLVRRFRRELALKAEGMFALEQVTSSSRPRSTASRSG